DSHVVTTTALTPVGEKLTRVFSMVVYRLPVPGWLVRLFATPVGLRIFSQDARVLALQAEAIDRFGGEQFVATEVDGLGPKFQRVLIEASRKEGHPGRVVEDEVKMRV